MKTSFKLPSPARSCTLFAVLAVATGTAFGLDPTTSQTLPRRQQQATKSRPGFFQRIGTALSHLGDRVDRATTNISYSEQPSAEVRYGEARDVMLTTAAPQARFEMPAVQSTDAAVLTRWDSTVTPREPDAPGLQSYSPGEHLSRTYVPNNGQQPSVTVTTFTPPVPAQTPSIVPAMATVNTQPEVQQAFLPAKAEPAKVFPFAVFMRYGRARSPYPPYNTLDVEGLPSGSLAKDPSTGEIFRVP